MPRGSPGRPAVRPAARLASGSPRGRNRIPRANVHLAKSTSRTHKVRRPGGRNRRVIDSETKQAEARRRKAEGSGPPGPNEQAVEKTSGSRKLAGVKARQHKRRLPHSIVRATAASPPGWRDRHLGLPLCRADPSVRGVAVVSWVGGGPEKLANPSADGRPQCRVHRRERGRTSRIELELPARLVKQHATTMHRRAADSLGVLQ